MAAFVCDPNIVTKTKFGPERPVLDKRCLDLIESDVDWSSRTRFVKLSVVYSRRSE